MKHLLPFFLFSVLLIGCKVSSTTTQQDKQQLTVIPSENFGAVKKSLNLSKVRTVNDQIAGITNLPLAEGLMYRDHKNYNEDNCLYLEKGMLGSCISLIVEKDGKYKLINTAEKLVNSFGPVDTEQKAIGFLFLLTRAYPQYNTEKIEGYVYYKESIAPTKITKTKSGYSVNLFSYDKFGCGPHEYYSCIYNISNDAKVKLINKEKIFRNPKQDGICVD